METLESGYDGADYRSRHNNDYLCDAIFSRGIRRSSGRWARNASRTVNPSRSRC